jgi:hypothetical protein
LNFFLVYLPKFTKHADELETPLDYWLHALTHSQPERQINEKLLRGDKLFAELLDTIDLNKLNKSEMKKYRASKLTFEDVRPFMTGHYDDGVEDGMQRGLLQGKQEGIQQERQQTALNALKMGL